jgi:multiple sugar transport system substrate-binding protein
MLKKFLLILLIPLLMSGCTNKSKEEITFSSWGSVSEVKILKQIISDFEKENPEIKINFIHIPQNYFPKIHLLFASNTASDVIFINNLSLPVYASKLEPLETWVNKQDFYKQSLDGLSYDGHLLAIPRDVSSLVFYVNSDLVNPPSENWNFDDFVDLIKSTKLRYLVSYEDDVYWTLPYLWAFGGGVLNDNFEQIIDSPESLKGIEFYKSLRDVYHVAPTKSQVGSSTLAQMFLDKKIALYLSGRWMFPKISERADFNWTIVPFPSVVPCDVSGWAVSKQSKHKQSAKKFVEYLSSEKSSEYFAQTGLIIPARIEASKKIGNEHNEQVFLKVIETSKKTPVNKDYKKLTDKINKRFK